MLYNGAIPYCMQVAKKKLKIIPLEITGNSCVFCRKFGQESSNKHLPLKDLEKHTHDLELL